MCTRCGRQLTTRCVRGTVRGWRNPPRILALQRVDAAVNHTPFAAAAAQTKTTGGHNDGRPGQLSAMVLVEDVPAHSGGFTVWPGSPAQLYHFWETSEGNGMSDVARPSYQQQLDQIIRTTRCARCT